MSRKMKVVAVIPSRMGSSRFPGKPLEKILGHPMIEHVRRRVEKVPDLDDVIVATCDEKIKEVVERSGGKVVMTSSTHERCTDRIEEAAQKIDADVIVNVQGDEPMVPVTAIQEVVEPFNKDEKVLTSCLVYPIKDFEELDSPNVVKTVLSNSKKILYLSRSKIPGKEVHDGVSYYKQSGIMAFRKEFLHQFSLLSPTPLEEKESVDMLRVLEHDFSIQAVVSGNETMGVDIPEQIGLIEEKIKSSRHEMRLFQEIFSK